MKEIEAVTLGQIKDLSKRLINDGKMSLTVFGPVKGEDFKGLF
jgi:predicted Zn-dependent peptidase